MQTITGVLIREPEIRYGEDGIAHTVFFIGTNSGEEIRVACFGTLAENVALSLTKGNLVTVVGEVPPTVFTATEVAASLRQATVEVARVPYHWDEEEAPTWRKETY